MSLLFEEQVELERDDRVRVPALRITPDFDDAERCKGAGVVVATDVDGATAEALDQVVRPLARLGYVVVAVRLTGHGDDAIEDLQAAILSVKELARGRIGLVGLGAAGPLTLEAATVLPQLDAVVVAGGGVPGKRARLGRVRAAILVHHAVQGAALLEADLTELVARLGRSKAPLTIRRHHADDGFFGGTSNQAVEAWAQTRAFLDLNLT